MPPRFCPQCGTAAVPDAKFCIQCGVALAGGTSRARSGRWEITTAGISVLGLFVVTGLGIWAIVLSPAPPTPGPGRGGGGQPAAQVAAQADLPPDHPKVPMQLPAEMKTFIDDLAKKASAAPDDVATWSKLGQVYYRTAQVDPTYYDKAKSAFAHVLELDKNNIDALRGLGSVTFELDEPEDAIAAYERYLALKPDDQTVRTAQGAAYVSAGDLEKAIPLLRDVIAKKPDTWPAHYYLGVALDQQGDRAAGIAAVKKARELAGEEAVRAQIDDTLARMEGRPVGGAAANAAESASPPAKAAATARTPFQSEVEKAFRAHQIMGPRIVGFEWSGPGAGRVLMQNFPMAGMPDDVKVKFTARLADALRDAAKANPPGGAVKMDIADAGTGDVMATVLPSS